MFEVERDGCSALWLDDEWELKVTTDEEGELPVAGGCDEDEDEDDETLRVVVILPGLVVSCGEDEDEDEDEKTWLVIRMLVGPAPRSDKEAAEDGVGDVVVDFVLSEGTEGLDIPPGR